MSSQQPPSPHLPTGVRVPRLIDTGAERKRALRTKDRVVFVPPCEDRERRERLEADDIDWLMFYFAAGTGEANRYTYDFTAQQREMAEAIAAAINEGDDQAIAASRGEGKSTLAQRLILKGILTGQITFAVLFAATGAAAANALEEIQLELENNQRLQADYPEVCTPIQGLQGIPQRARTMLATGRRHDDGQEFVEVQISFSWCGQQVYMPNVPGSLACSGIIATRGLDAEVRGLRIKGRRVDLALIDDPDTEETARSEDQAEKLEKRIDRAIAGLGSQTQNVSRVMLVTIQSTISVSFKFTDPKQKPSWRGKRYRFLVHAPEDIALWQTFVTLWQEDRAGGTNKAHEFYLENRAAMDKGAVVSNPNRFTRKESTALEYYYALVARLGPDAVATEYDNDPPAASEPTEIGISPKRIQKQTSGFDRKIIPVGCTVLTQGIDVKKSNLHWVVRAWMPSGFFYTIDYGVFKIEGVQYGVEEGVELAVRKAILERMEEFKQCDYRGPDGEINITDPLTLCDARYQRDAVLLACAEIGSNIMPVMGVGLSKGCAKGRTFSPARETTPTRKPGDHYNLVIAQVAHHKLWMIEADTDHWKRWEHDRWMTGPDHPGRMLLYGKQDETSLRYGSLSHDQFHHHGYAMHICNEREIDEPYKGGLRKVWRARADNVHYLDASYYSNVAARIRGITILKPVQLPKRVVKRPRIRVQNLNV